MALQVARACRRMAVANGSPMVAATHWPLPMRVRTFAVAAASAADKVKTLVDSHGCVVFAKSTCPFCALAKEVLQGELQAKCHFVEMDKEMSPTEAIEMKGHFLKLTGENTVPRVFIGGKCVGGGSEVKQLHERGELKTLLEKAGAL
eukprot:CAMPEP_0170603956 /NCGR_PEP_ID=MMETSP0224-20130122/19176_1 /TAXON_ID=285029 /ORGANISM="Togula jolla, Strain CCCM 725" /LENGTH=146 /DNA_ID=CAMNT_0010928847 /DNA_START=22 /DNA_END=462 /DNA_ORIENTATION=+